MCVHVRAPRRMRVACAVAVVGSKLHCAVLGASRGARVVADLTRFAGANMHASSLVACKLQLTASTSSSSISRTRLLRLEMACCKRVKGATHAGECGVRGTLVSMGSTAPQHQRQTQPPWAHAYIQRRQTHTLLLVPIGSRLPLDLIAAILPQSVLSLIHCLPPLTSLSMYFNLGKPPVPSSSTA